MCVGRNRKYFARLTYSRNTKRQQNRRSRKHVSYKGEESRWEDKCVRWVVAVVENEEDEGQMMVYSKKGDELRQWSCWLVVAQVHACAAWPTTMFSL